MTDRSARRLVSFLAILLCLTLGCSLAFAAETKAVPAKKSSVQGGVGLQVVPVASGEIVVIAVLAKSPAAQAKILPGDLIIAVDGASLRGSDFADVTKSRLWGKAGSKVKLTWLRPGVAGKKSAQLVRAALKGEPAQDLEVKILAPAEPPLSSEATKP